MNEWFSPRYENWANKEGLNHKTIPSFLTAENQVREQFIRYQDREWARNLAVRQVNENNNLREWLETQVQQETREQLDRQAMINESKTMLYEKLWINEDLSKNNWWENFWKWIVDTLILDNYDLAIQVWETNWKVIVDSIKELFSSWDNIKKLAEALWNSVMWLFSLDWYQTWKSVAELWLVTTWVWAGAFVWKKAFKFWLKEIARLRRPAERIVESSEVKGVIWQVNNRVNEIVPKQEADIDDIVRRKVNIEEQIRWLEQLWIPESLSKDMIESWLLTPLPNVEKFDLLKRFEFFNKKWIDINKMVDEAVKQVPNLTREEALLIFSYTDYFLYWKLNAFMRWDKELLASLTPENIQATQRIILKLEQALEKMPNLKPWEDWFILRWDKWKYWDWKIWDEIDLRSFTSVSNNKEDIFLWGNSRNDTQISIIWREWRVKDISPLAIAVNFWDVLNSIEKTTNEWVILPNSRVIITDRFRLDDVNYIDVKQIK